LSEYVDRDVAFIVLNTERADPTNNGISTMHYLPFMGNDVYAVKSPRPPFSGQKSVGNLSKKYKPARKENITFFNHRSLLIEPAQKRISQRETLLGEISETENSFLITMLNDYPNLDNDTNKIDIFRSFSKVHELKSSTNEFLNFQKRVDSNESSEYAKEKNHLELSLNNLQSNKKITK
jgi:hypothetical protein